MVDENAQRVAAFGKFAGVAGMVIMFYDFCHRPTFVLFAQRQLFLLEAIELLRTAKQDTGVYKTFTVLSIFSNFKNFLLH